MNSPNVPPAKRTLSIQPTQQCTAACDHCGTFSSPAARTRLPRELALQAIQQAAQEGYGGVAFTGGEPTLSGKWLLHAIEAARALGMHTRVVTNGWWAKTPEAADRLAHSFADSGLNEITFSTGDQHTRFVTLNCVVRGVCASVHARLRTVVVIEIVNSRSLTKQSFNARPEIQELSEARTSRQLLVCESPWMPLSPETVSQYPPGVAANRDNLGRRDGCDDIFSTVTIGADGTISACCGIGMRLIPDLQLGNIADTTLAAGYAAAERDSLKRRVRVEGPEHLLAWAAARDPTIQWENMYAHRCQACIRLYTDPQVRRVLMANSCSGGDM